MPQNASRVVLDTNVIVRAFINTKSNAGRILLLCEQRDAVPLLSTEVLREYRAIVKHPAIVSRYPQLERPEVEVSLERLMYVSDFYRDIKVRFVFQRDPKDAPLLELAIAGRATHLITVDNDLLSLPHGRDDAAKRFRQRFPDTSIVTPEQYLSFHEGLFAV